MTNAIETIAAKLADLFAEFDAKNLTDAQEWATVRVAAIREWKASPEAQAVKNNAWKYYPMLHAVAGGKTWYNVFEGRSTEMIAEFVTKNCKAIAAKRNASISAKLTAAGVREVLSEEITRSHDGFNGLFVVNTDAGRKVVTIQTIYAGGYNIQCFHLRVLVKVK